jgi:alpha-beta hydrolase superfamily lysophospholipase
MLIKITLYSLIGYFALCAVVFMAQRYLIYLPDTVQLPLEQVNARGLRPWPSADHFLGFMGLQETAPFQGTIIVFHGNAGAAHDRSFYVQALARQRFRVLLAEYPGYGGRGDKPSEETLVRDALATIRLAHQQFGEPLFLWGESLGCGVAAAALKQTDVPVQGVVLFLPWDSLSEVAQTHYLYMPARWLVLDRYDSVNNLRGYTGNVAVILAGDDEIIPVHHGRRLYESLATRKKLWLFDGARHNEMPLASNLSWWGEVTDFIVQSDNGKGYR